MLVAMLVAVGSLEGFSVLHAGVRLGRMKEVDASDRGTLPRTGTPPQERQVTDAPTNEDLPSWKNVGQTIAYIIGSQQFGTGTAIGLVQADGSAERVAAFGPPSIFNFAGSLSWVGSSNQLMLAETVNLSEYLTFDTSQVPFVRVALDGGDEAFGLKLSTVFLGGWWVKVSRDGSTVAWRVSSRGRCGLTQIRVASFDQLNGQDADSVGSVLLEGVCESLERPLFIDGFSLTPDGSKLVISLPPEGEEGTFDILGGVPLDLYMYSTAGSGAAVRMTTSGETAGFRNYLPEVSPDGSKVLFTHIDATTGRIYSVKLDGSELTQMTERQAFSGTWSPTGQQIAFSSSDGVGGARNTNIYVTGMPTCDSDPSMMTPIEGEDWTGQPRFDNDGDGVPEEEEDGVGIMSMGSMTMVCSPFGRAGEAMVMDPDPLTGHSGAFMYFRDYSGHRLKFTVEVTSYDENYRPLEMQVTEERIVDGSVTQTKMGRIFPEDANEDGVPEAVSGEMMEMIPAQTGPLGIGRVTFDLIQMDVNDDDEPDFVTIPWAMAGMLGIRTSGEMAVPQIFLPLGDTTGDGHNDSPGFLDPVLPQLPLVAGPIDPPLVFKLHFAQFGDGGGLSSRIILFNLHNGKEADVTIELRDDNGDLLQVDLNGAEVNGQLDLQIPAGGARVLKSDGAGAVQTGSVWVTSDRPLAGVILFAGPTGVAGVGNGQLTRRFLAPIRGFASRGERTGIAVASQQSSPVEINLTLFRLSQQVGEATINLPANGHLARFGDELFPGLEFEDSTDLLVGEASGEVVATVLQTRPGEFITLPVSSESGGDLTQYFPHFGKGGDLLASEIILVNLTSDPASANLKVTGDDGKPLTLNLNAQPVVGNLDLDLEGLGTAFLTTEQSGEVQSGAISVQADQRIAGVIVFGGAVGAAGVGASPSFHNGFVAFVEGDQAPSGIAVTNLQDANPVDLTVRLFSLDGQLLETVQVALPAGGHLARFLSELFPDLDLADFEGILKVQSSGPVSAIVLQTRSDPDLACTEAGALCQFATLPVARLLN